tara:strand:- start:1883 stop:2596 length:714 start_codon:yes stop_codon:yes gene_type:complete
MKKIFPILQPTITILFILIACIVYGLSLAPSILLFNYINEVIDFNSLFMNALCLGATLSLCFFIFGISLIFIVGAIVRILPIKPRPGIYPLASLNTLKWGLCGAFLRLVNLTFLSFITPTFLNIIYFRMIGAKIGKNVQLNTININDPWLLEIGDNSVIGGGSSINCHTVEGGKLILEQVKIGNKCTIGAQSLVWPGCIIGNSSILATKSVLKKRTIVGDREIWKGNPAVNVRAKKK